MYNICESTLSKNVNNVPFPLMLYSLSLSCEVFEYYMNPSRASNQLLQSKIQNIFTPRTAHISLIFQLI